MSATPSPSRSPAASDAGETIQSTTLSPSTSTPPRFASSEQSSPRSTRITPFDSLYVAAIAGENVATMLGGPALAGLLKLTTIGVAWTSTWAWNGSPRGALLNSHLTLGARTPGVAALTHAGSCAGA